jgi:hypothetical protein
MPAAARALCRRRTLHSVGRRALHCQQQQPLLHRGRRHIRRFFSFKASVPTANNAGAVGASTAAAETSSLPLQVMAATIPRLLAGVTLLAIVNQLRGSGADDEANAAPFDELNSAFPLNLSYEDALIKENHALEQELSEVHTLLLFCFFCFFCFFVDVCCVCVLACCLLFFCSHTRGIVTQTITADAQAHGTQSPPRPCRARRAAPSHAPQQAARVSLLHFEIEPESPG